LIQARQEWAIGFAERERLLSNGAWVLYSLPLLFSMVVDKRKKK